EGLVLNFGAQRLSVPWDDPRVSSLISHHGETVIVGIRPDTLAPIAPGSPAPPGTVLSGRVRALEFHGHEWLAYADAGIPTVDAAELGRPPAPVNRRAPRTGLRDRLRQLVGGGGGEQPAEEHEGHHRRTDLVFRIPPGRRPNR